MTSGFSLTYDLPSLASQQPLSPVGNGHLIRVALYSAYRRSLPKMPTVNRLYCVLILHLFLVFDSVERANAQATNALRSQRIQKENRHQQYESHFLSKKFRALTGNTQNLRFDDSSVVKDVIHDVTSHLLRKPSGEEISDELAPDIEAEYEEAYPRRRLSMVMAVAAASPSAVARQGFALSASIQHLQVAFKATGDVLRRGGQKAKKGTIAAVKTIGRYLQSALTFFLWMYRRVIAFIVIGTINGLQSISGGLKTMAVKTDVPNDSPAAAAKSPTPSPTTTVSTPPVMSRISTSSSSSSSSSTTFTTSAHFPTWLSSSSSSTSSAPVVSKTTPAKKKSQALSNISIQKLMNTFKRNDDDKSLEVVPEQSFLAGMFSSLMGGLFVLSTGALVGYLWSDWRDERQKATMRNDDFIDATEVDFGMRQLRNRAVPITPELSRYPENA